MLEKDQVAIVLPKWDTVLHQFESGMTTISDEFDRIIEAYGSLASGSAAISQANAADMPQLDMRGWIRDGSPDIGSYEYAPITGLRFVRPRGWTVYLGVGDGMAYKATVLQAAEERFGQEGVRKPSLIDLRFPDSPYYRFPDE